MGNNKPATPAIKGAIITLVLLVAGCILYFGAGMANRRAVYILCFLLAACITVSANYFAKQMSGNVTFGNVFAEGFKTVSVVIVLSAICVFISLKFIFPGIIDKLLQAGSQQMKQDGAKDDEIKTYIDTARGYMVPMIIGMIIFAFGIVGAIGAAFGAMVADKKPVAPVN